MAELESVHKYKEQQDLRACLLCSLVKPYQHFRELGCDNCEELLNLRSHSNKILECTTSNFSGVVALFKPEDSWVSRWCRLEDKVKGIYALQVNGRLPKYVQDQLSEEGIRYFPRDGTEHQVLGK